MPDFFEEGFDHGTEIKLALYGRYLRKWFPVFAHARGVTKYNKVNLFDFFSGPGKDSNDNPGSPIIALKEASLYARAFLDNNRQVNFYFYDKSKKEINKLKDNINPWIQGEYPFNIFIDCAEFPKSLDKHLHDLVNDMNLLFIDQYGIKYMTREIFNTLTNFPKNDLIFFVSSSSFLRFSSTPEFKALFPDITEEELQYVKQKDVHKFISNKYQLWLKQKNIFITHFSIMKNGNVYGLIFVSHHIKGMRKFLDACWEIDKDTGEANYDIWTGNIKTQSPQNMSLFLDQKIERFQSALETILLSGRIKNERELYSKIIRAGMLPKHAKNLVAKLWKEKKITTSNGRKPRISEEGYNNPRSILTIK